MDDGYTLHLLGMAVEATDSHLSLWERPDDGRWFVAAVRGTRRPGSRGIWRPQREENGPTLADALAALLRDLGVEVPERPTAERVNEIAAALCDPPTSHAAADSARPGAATIRTLVLNTLRAASRSRNLGGMTDEELVAYFDEQKLPGTPSGIRTRRRELVDADPPLVIDSGRHRQTITGRRATVWVARPEQEDPR